MVRNLFTLSQGETRRLVWIIALLFALIVTLQYFELLYSNFLLTLGSYGNGPLLSSPSNNTGLDKILERPNKTATDEFVGIDGHDGILAVNSSSTLTTEDLIMNHVHNSATKALVRKDVIAPASVIEKTRKIPDVYTLSDLNNLLSQSRESYYSEIPKWSSTVDRELHDAVLQIENAPIVNSDPELYAPIYRNISMFKRSYELMENTLKVYIYKEGERPIMHTPILEGIYASEGWFMKQMEANKRFVTEDSQKAHMFYLPFSSLILRQKVYVNSQSHKNMEEYLKNYVDFIAGKYPNWNRTGGADHFLVACHDVAPGQTRKSMAKCIRSLCNSDAKRGYIFGKDVSLPETNVVYPTDPLKNLGRSKSPSKKSTLAFFAGSMHGPLRSILLQHWENKDPDMKIFGRLPRSKGNKNYVNYMKSSKYCICAKGYEVNSPRVVEAIFYDCVPVIISDNFVPPFFETLKWESFAVFVAEKDVADLKKILVSIPEKKYKRMQMMVKKVQQHFLWHNEPKRYDIFHMILHSIWHNRLHRIRYDH